MKNLINQPESRLVLMVFIALLLVTQACIPKARDKGQSLSKSNVIFFALDDHWVYQSGNH